jgi:hypothetical protein
MQCDVPCCVHRCGFVFLALSALEMRHVASSLCIGYVVCSVLPALENDMLRAVSIGVTIYWLLYQRGKCDYTVCCISIGGAIYRLLYQHWRSDVLYAVSALEVRYTVCGISIGGAIYSVLCQHWRCNIGLLCDVSLYQHWRYDRFCCLSVLEVTFSCSMCNGNAACAVLCIGGDMFRARRCACSLFRSLFAKAKWLRIALFSYHVPCYIHALIKWIFANKYIPERHFFFFALISVMDPSCRVPVHYTTFKMLSDTRTDYLL